MFPFTANAPRFHPNYFHILKVLKGVEERGVDMKTRVILGKTV